MKLEKCEQERKISPECCRVTSRGSTHTCTAGSQYRSQQEEMLPCILKWHYFTTTTSNRKPDNSSTNERLSQLNEKPLHFELPVSSNGLFVYNSPSQLPLLLYKSFLLLALLDFCMFRQSLLVPNCNSVLLLHKPTGLVKKKKKKWAKDRNRPYLTEEDI